MSSIGARLDRVPFSRFHARLLMMGGLGYMFEAVDVAIIAFVMPVIKAFFTWIPSLLVERGMGITGSYTYALALYAAQVPGYLTGAVLNDVIGRRAVITLYMLFGALAALALAMARSDVWILLAGSFLSFFMNGSYAGICA